MTIDDKIRLLEAYCEFNEKCKNSIYYVNFLYFCLDFQPLFLHFENDILKDLKRCSALGGKVMYDDTAGIGRLYRRQDEVGTPYCITVDVDSLADKKVTVRDRDSMKQDRIAVNKVREYLEEKFNEKQ